ncbi:NAD(P)H-dependent FMN reductase [Marininema mesophilum]|uniref:NAD(P)H-dependent FMN reductase n=1 Tax=Marininema mesophilum TaxID=1048340 RepID=A0A1H3BJY6_9BACL|nr:NAD(P)H-dependent oxidoreductase [Marininema mesophilum]SDX42270.1 NAD(P)H-dependent FMN reductase [Marininema mesophilum]
MAKVVLINGSMNPESVTKRILQLFAELLQKEGHETELICVAETNFPLFSFTVPRTEEMNKVTEQIKEADAIIVGSPEYHGGYTGALKNLLDYQDGTIFKGKPIALLAVTGGLKSGTLTLVSLRQIFRTLHANVIPEELAVSSTHELDQNGQLNENCSNRVLGVIDGLRREWNR